LKSDFETAWRRRFEDFGIEHDDEAGIAGWSETGLRTRLRNFVRSWNHEQAGTLWLDAGCGAGSYSRVFVACGKGVVALDYSVPTLQKARQRLLDEKVAYVAGDVRHLPLRSASFDGAICFGVMQALSSPNSAISELARVVRPGGHIWVDALNAYCLPNLADRLFSSACGREARLRYDSPRRLSRAFRESGFQEVQMIWVPIMPRNFQVLQRVLESGIFRALLTILPWFGSAVSHAFVIRARR
jgi:ubiquinone/menaquinone biosynthesis C-methylase UbiE